MRGRARLRARMARFCVCLGLIAFMSTASEGADPLRGPAFTDPEDLQQMPGDWREKPIEYPSSIEEGAELVVTLNQQIAPALMPLIESYVEEKGVRLAIKEGTCGISAGELARKEIDMGGYCCPPGKPDRLPGLEFATLGITPLAIIVHPDNPVDNLTLKQVRDLFAGRILNWSEVGGENLPVRPFGMTHCKKRPGHWRLILPDADHLSPTFQSTVDIPDTFSVVGANPKAISWEIVMNAERFRNKGRVKFVAVDGVSPLDLRAATSGRYPFYRVLNVTLWSDEHLANAEATRLLEFLMDGISRVGERYNVVPAEMLRQEGWKFSGRELIGEPEATKGGGR